jgi:hypothetical protein
MSNRENLQPELRKKANDLLNALSPSEREAIIDKCWMSHDARWFMAVAREYGMKAANRINQTAVRDTAKVEMPRLFRALERPPVQSIEDYLLMQEAIIGLFGPDALDYNVSRIDDDTYQVHIKRCFACDNATRAGIADEFECGVFARFEGWLESFNIDFEMTPPLGKCLMLQGKECLRTFRFKEVRNL